MRTGVHYILDLIDPEGGVRTEGDIRSLLNLAADLMATRIHSYYHQFDPWGVTGVVIVEESHISIHTWPELGVVNVDVFTCAQEIDAVNALKFIIQRLKPQRVEWQKLYRGRHQLEGVNHVKSRSVDLG